MRGCSRRLLSSWMARYVNCTKSVFSLLDHSTCAESLETGMKTEKLDGKGRGEGNRNVLFERNAPVVEIETGWICCQSPRQQQGADGKVEQGLLVVKEHKEKVPAHVLSNLPNTGEERPTGITNDGCSIVTCRARVSFQTEQNTRFQLFSFLR